MALRRTLKQIFSNNGTNFKAIVNQVQEELRKIDFNEITIHYEAIKWRFNPCGVQLHGRSVGATSSFSKNSTKINMSGE